MKWYTQYLRPWGYSIGSYEESFPMVLGKTQRITRHRTKKGRIKHYATSHTGLRTDGTYGVQYFKNLADTMEFLHQAVSTGMVPPT
jgi:hypothetical protein